MNQHTKMFLIGLCLIAVFFGMIFFTLPWHMPEDTETPEASIKQIFAERKYQPILFKGKTEGGQRSIAIEPKDPAKRADLNHLVAEHRMLDRSEKDSADQLVRLMDIRKEIMEMIPEKDAKVISELRILCDSWALQLGIANPVFEFEGCGKYASDFRD